MSVTDLTTIFNRLHEKIMKREEEDRHHAERAQRRAVDALRSVIKHLDPPVRATDAWTEVKARVEGFEEYRALDDEARRAAFDKVVRRLKEKEADSERDRDRDRHRDRERDPRRNGTSDRRDRDRDARAPRSRHSRTPEIDAYEADRKRAVAERERQYRKASFTAASPPPVSEPRSSRHGRGERVDSPRERERFDGRERERDERYERGRLSAGPGPYDRERRDRELDRERNYGSRADPREGAAKVLDYGESDSVGASAGGGGSVTGAVGHNGGSSSRRRRGSDGGDDEEEGGKRDSKRAKVGRERDGVARSKTPAKEEAKEEEALKSGSEEGEIEEV